MDRCAVVLLNVLDSKLYVKMIRGSQQLLKSLSVTVTSSLRRPMSSSPSKLEGKVAVVTASTDGIGYAIAERLGMDGAKVMTMRVRLLSCQIV